MRINSISIVVACCLLSGCAAEYSAVYQRVDADSKWDETARFIENNSGDEPSPYKIRDNRLYLMIQMNRVDWHFHTVVTYPSWDSAEIFALLEQNPDINSLMPVDWNNWLPKGYGDECKGNKQDTSAGDE